MIIIIIINDNNWTIKELDDTEDMSIEDSFSYKGFCWVSFIKTLNCIMGHYFIYLSFKLKIALINTITWNYLKSKFNKKFYTHIKVVMFLAKSFSILWSVKKIWPLHFDWPPI